MDMEQALDEAARATAELNDILTPLLADGTIDFLSPGSTGVQGGEHHPKIGVHLNIDRVAFRQRRDELSDLVRPANERGVEVIFFPA